jgi:HNH endonuclease
MTDSPDIPLELSSACERQPADGLGTAARSWNRRSELERLLDLKRLLDLTVLEPTHPELGSCWRFTGTTTPYGRIAKAQDSYTHRLGWKLLRGPIPDGMELHHRCGVYACWNPDHLKSVTHGEPERLPGAAAPPEPLAPIPHRIRYVNHPSALASLLIHGSVERHVDVS